MIAASTSNGSLSALELFTPAQPRLGRRPTPAPDTVPGAVVNQGSGDPVRGSGVGPRRTGAGDPGPSTWPCPGSPTAPRSTSSSSPPRSAGSCPTRSATNAPQCRSTVAPLQPNTLRVTHIYRREHGDWKLVHRHGDHPPIN